MTLIIEHYYCANILGGRGVIHYHEHRFITIFISIVECSSIKQTWIEYRLIHNVNRLLFLTYSNIRYISFIL